MSDSPFLTASRLGSFDEMVDGRDIAMVDGRVSQLQSELLAEDLTPPPESENWSDHRLRRWFENGGGPNQQLSSFLQSACVRANRFIRSLHARRYLRCRQSPRNIRPRRNHEEYSIRGRAHNCGSRSQRSAPHERSASPSASASRRRRPTSAHSGFVLRYTTAWSTKRRTVRSILAWTFLRFRMGCLSTRRALEASSAAEHGHARRCSQDICGEAETRSNLAHNASVIELGAGIGICGLYAAGLGARQLLLTDIIVDGSSGEANELDTALNENIARNRELLGLHSVVMGIAQLNFSEASEASACRSMSDGGEGFDVVLASDVTYAPIGVDFEHLVTCIKTVLKQNGVALVCHETRLGMQRGSLHRTAAIRWSNG